MTEEQYKEIMEKRKEYQRDYHRRWRAKNPDKVKAINARFYAKKVEEQKKAAKDPANDN